MEENYQKNKYEKVIEIVNQLPPFFLLLLNKILL